MKQTYQRFINGISHHSRQWILLLCAIMFSASPALSQTGRTIRGTVTDEKNQPLPGVSVLIAGTNTGVMTDVNGAYSLNVNGNIVTLKFSFIGYLPKEVKVGADNTVNVSLQPDARQLKDVIVIGYGTSSKKDVTGAITSVKAEEFNAGVLTTPAELLQGKVAGLNITKSGDPNKQPATILRGPSTLREGAAQQPFYVIDGVPGASIDLLAPADIESIDVLKDASSTAIYGSRAANGVIIVTTRKARAGQTRLTYSGYGATWKKYRKH
jgi:TonB-dependent SusC/RagA subfamily outer membrane receptor